MRLIVDGYGKSLGKRDNQIVIRENGHEVDYFLAEDLSQVIITGKGSVSFDALQLLARHQVDMVVLNWTGDVIYRLSPPEIRNVQARREQFLGYDDERSGFLSKEFIRAKLENQKSVLGSIAKHREDDNPIYGDLLKFKSKISEYIERLMRVETRPVDYIRGKIFGIEGKASIEYWKGIALVVPAGFGFRSRSGRGATDGINAMLNYGYGILKGYVWRSIHLASLDPYAGFLHADRWGRASMVFDLIEEFRQQIVDRTILSLVNHHQVKESEFTMEDGICRMTNRVRRLLISKVLDKMESKIRYGNNHITWAGLINHQANLLAKYLKGEAIYKGFYRRW